MNPFDLSGPQFLGLYVVLFVAAAGVAALLRWSWRQPADEPGPEALDLSPYEVAYLAGGPQLAVNAAIARLVQQGALAASATERKLTRKEGPAPASSAAAVEKAVYEAVNEYAGDEIKTVRDKVAPALDPICRRLQDMGLLVTDDQAATARWAPLLLALGVVAFGAIKIFVGLARDRPVAYLVILCIATGVGALIGFARAVFRSRRGDLALARLKEANAAMEYSAQRRPDALVGNDLPLAVGLFGMGVLAGGPLEDLQTSLKPKPGTSSCGGGCGSGGGGGGCGGGCGGGGCGGCGG